jgi:hypothetical protein
MASKYEEMCDIAETARKNWFVRRDHCRQHTVSLVVGLLSYCGIPNEAVRFLRWNEKEQVYSEPEKGNYLLPGAMVFDDAGDCRLGICIVLAPPGPSFAEQYVSFGLYVFEQAGKVMAQLGPSKPMPADPSDSAQCSKFYDVVVDCIIRAFTEPQKSAADKIGFKRSQMVTNEEGQPQKGSSVP